MIHVIVGVRCPPDEPERARNTLATLRALRAQVLPRDQYQIVLVEEDSEPRWNQDRVLTDQTWFLKSELPYNRGAVFNYGVEKCQPAPDDILCLIDSDLVVPKDFLTHCIEDMRASSVLIAFDEIRYLNETESCRVAEVLENKDPAPLEIDDTSIDTTRSKKRKHPGVGGAMWIRSELYTEVGGHDAEYVGWGCEDSDLHLRLELRLNHTILRANLAVLHLWHQDAERGEVYERNRQRFKFKRNPKLNYGLPPNEEGVLSVSGGGCEFHFGPKAQQFGRYWTVMTKEKRTLAEPDMLYAIGALNLRGTYVDVGAHVGNHTAFFAECCPSTRVVAIEPDTDRMAALMETVHLNRLRGVKTLQVGAWSGPGYVVPTETLSFTFTETHIPMAVETRTLDDILKKDTDVVLIKIDTEGTEREILQGAERVLAEQRPHLFIETIRDSEFTAIDRLLGSEYRHVAVYNATPTHHWAPRVA